VTAAPAARTPGLGGQASQPERTEGLLDPFLRTNISEAGGAGRERQRLMDWLLLAMIVVGAVGIAVHEIARTARASFVLDLTLLTELVSLAVLAMGVVLNRAGHTRAAAAITVVLCFVSALVLANPANGGAESLGVLAYLLVPIVTATLMFSLTWAGVVVAASVLMTAGTPLIYGTPEFLRVVLDDAMFIAVVGALLVLAARHRNRIDRIRRAETTAQEAKYRFLTENMRDVLFIADLQMTVLYVSPSVEAVGGYSPGELQGRSFGDFVAPAGRPQVAEAFREDLAAAAMGAPAPPLREFECMRKDGSTFFGEVHAAFLRDNSRAPVGLQAVLRDITGRKKGEEERHRLQDELRQAEKLRAIGHLAGGMAHDFNNQLAGIMACADLLRASLADNPQLRELADMIATTCERSSHLTHQLLAFARRGAAQARPVDLHAVIGELVGMLQHTIDKRIRIVQRLAASPATVIGDQAQLQNAVLNVALNARDAMPEGGDMTFATENVTLDEEFCSRSVLGVTPGAYVQVRITDTGVGMDPQTMQHLFEPFFTTKEKGKGTGMGLAAVHGTVYGHKGTLTVTSAPGKGTTFAMFLPVATEGLVGATQQPVQGSERRKARILIADDEELVLMATTRLLEAAGHTVHQAHDGREAVEHYRKSWTDIDLVVLDMVMPEMNGGETFEFIREINPKARIVLASGYALDADAQKLLTEGTAGFVQKPFTGEALLRAIDDALRPSA